jgi:hypothetical protein
MCQAARYQYALKTLIIVCIEKKIWVFHTDKTDLRYIDDELWSDSHG